MPSTYDPQIPDDGEVDVNTSISAPPKTGRGCLALGAVALLVLAAAARAA